jgi:FAD binding domain
VERGATADPCVLVVEFRLRAVRRRGHAVFRRESLLNTPLFAGFPGFVSKLWLADDERGRYRPRSDERDGRHPGGRRGSSRVTVQRRVADSFRRGRLYLAGDAAHAYSPATGQGMKAGIQDAVNLGWKLAFAAAQPGDGPLLDSPLGGGNAAPARRAPSRGPAA